MPACAGGAPTVAVAPSPASPLLVRRVPLRTRRAGGARGRCSSASESASAAAGAASPPPPLPGASALAPAAVADDAAFALALSTAALAAAAGSEAPYACLGALAPRATGGGPY